ncbi:hypothetical protein [Neisseria sp. S1]|uniref:hypothetical protein n=1 Tax=Neisseria sp. S1 TaxID=3318354 RepID=UPI003A890CAC
MQHIINLMWGLPVPGTDRVVKQVILRPLTIGGELRAVAELEDMDLGDGRGESGKTTAMIAETLAYWAQQLTVDGIDPKQMTATYLMDNLTGEDYNIILAEQDVMRTKYTAATVPSAAAAAENP